ncbi:MAG: GNAT family N-acetyltransferase, partial [Asgard group archaeon]|nr:GNAT family N-acetyltransferase [Asgard group archaeon]
AVIAGINPGRIWVDSKEKPTSGFLVDNVWSLFLAGNPNNSEFNASIGKLLKDEIFPIAKNQEKITYGEWIFYFEHQDWLEKIVNEFGIKDPVPIRRYHYLFEKLLVPDWRAKIPEGFVMRKIDESLLKQKKLENLDDVKEWIIPHYGNEGKFFELGSGFCLVENEEKIACWCVSDWRVGNRIEISIATANDYRRRGFATLCVAAHVEYYYKKGYQIGWHCYQENEGSWRTAEKVGFVRKKSYIAATGFYNEKDNLVYNAWHKGIVLEKPEVGISYIKKLMEIGMDRRAYYVYVQLLIKLNRFSEAIDTLMKIVELGPADPVNFKNTLETQELFQDLRKMKEWKILMESIDALIK